MSEPSADAPKKDELSALRHELRTPLNQIIGYSEMLQEDAEEKGATDSVGDLQKIHTAAHNLLKLINEKLVPSHFAEGGLFRPIGTRESSPEKPAESEAISTPAIQAPQLIQPDHGNLLVVDDIAENRDMLGRRLEKQGYTVTAAENGRRALEVLKEKEFDLVLLDIMMPEMDGIQVLERLKSDPDLRHIPVIMISALDEMKSVVRCITIGAEDYLPKPFDPVLLRARIGACLEKKRLRDKEQLMYQALVESQKALAAELAEAAAYVRSLLPPPLKGEIVTDWRFIPSTALGGDAFGYHWLDEGHFAMYLLDVCGHGVGAALLSISVMNVLRSQSLSKTDFRNPGEVLNALNEAFPMEKQNNMYFTLWYGVYDKHQRELKYANGGHPSPLLMIGPSEAKARMEPITVGGTVVGAMPKISYRTGQVQLEAYARLCVFSDGIYEVTKTAGGMMSYDDFIQLVKIPPRPGASNLDRILRIVQDLHGASAFEDDVSIMEIAFG
jgi:sigma-B regulation protein RsbU (phosphoserine phosphatase)